jgi:hypothetical protein
VAAWTQRLKEAGHRGTDRALVRFSVGAERRRSRSDFESDVAQLNTSFARTEAAQCFLTRASDCLRGHRVAADADNDVGVSISRLMAQSHGLRRALTPGPIRCPFCDR